ncbi:hypothetical protein [Microbacterium sp. Root180]|uniref:PH-like domain-containing protein n=1 Tax=Microbacterium sp. Root180 TaxID=1736483 RepID=UPI0006FCD76A|nr:hypothetical protein [Microbacterium sp. Root180]KRB37845.1 hypothetical protein ASD93_05835 [Microbacterium sp. Root180]
MTREGALIVTVIAALALVVLGVWAWRRRARRDSAFVAPVAEAPDGAAVLAVFASLYVATTRHGEPLERLAVKGLAFRSRADVTVTDAGVAIDLTGQPRVFVDVARILDVAQSTVAIDRVVERDGLTRLSWRTDDGSVVDSYFRPQDASARALADAVSGILLPSQTGTDA